MTRGIQKMLDELEPGLNGITIDSTVLRPATFVEQSIASFPGR